MTEKLTLVAIFAHPDDEAFGTGGTLIKYAREGVAVHLIMATGGEAGRVANPNVTATLPFSLLREQELRRACQHYSLAQLHMLGYLDGQTAIVPPAEPVFKIVKLLRQIKPQVVMSFGPEGVYGHFDHLVVHRWATAAVELAADPAKWPEAGPAHQVRKFYHRAIPQAQIDSREPVDMGGVPFPFAGYAPEQITTTIDVREVAEIKRQAICCHLSQISPDMPLLYPDFNLLENEWFWQETYILARAHGLPPLTPMETDLFAGVR